MLLPVVVSIEVDCDKPTAFTIFAEQMPTWWPLTKRAMSLYSGSKPKVLEIEAEAGGTIVEVGEDGVRHHWGTFRRFEPSDLLSLDFHMGLPPEQSGQVEVVFTALDGGRTSVKLTHSNWEGYGEMADTMRSGYGGSWGLIFADAYGSACYAAGKG